MPENSIKLLDLFAESCGLSASDKMMMRRLLNTAYQEGRLHRMQEEYNIKYGENEQANTIQHYS